MRGVWTGLLPAMLASAPSAGAFFSSYDWFRGTVAPALPTAIRPFGNGLAAVCGNLAQSLVRTPFEAVKQRLQAGVDPTIAACVSSLVKTKGVTGLWTGLGALILRDLPFDAIQYPIYEAFKKGLARAQGKDTLDNWQTFACGSMAGGITAAVTTPLDVVKTRLMTAAPGQYSGFLNCVASVTAEEGLAVLFQGVVPRVVMISIGGAVFFGAYETTKKLLDKQFPPANSKAQAASRVVSPEESMAQLDKYRTTALVLPDSSEARLVFDDSKGKDRQGAEREGGRERETRGWLG